MAKSARFHGRSRGRGRRSPTCRACCAAEEQMDERVLQVLHVGLMCRAVVQGARRRRARARRRCGRATSRDGFPAVRSPPYVSCEDVWVAASRSGGRVRDATHKRLSRALGPGPVPLIYLSIYRLTQGRGRRPLDKPL